MPPREMPWRVPRKGKHAGGGHALPGMFYDKTCYPLLFYPFRPFVYYHLHSPTLCLISPYFMDL